MILLAVLACAALGALVGAVELLDRYRSRPGAALASLPGAAYVAINAAAAAAAYVVIEQFGWTFGLSDPTAQRTAQILVAGFASMTFLRSSLFVLQQGDTRLDAGPSAVLGALRDAANRAVDQRQAAALIGTDWTSGLRFARDHESLTLLCLTSLVDPGEASAVILGRTAAEVGQTSAGDDVKMQTYAMALVKQFGVPPVVAAVARLRATLAASSGNPARTEPPSAEETAAEQGSAGEALEQGEDTGAGFPLEVGEWGAAAWDIEQLIRATQSSSEFAEGQRRNDVLSTIMVIELRLFQMSRLPADPDLAAAAADAVPPDADLAVRDAAVALFGSQTRLTEDPRSRGRALAGVWDRARGGNERLVHGRGLRRGGHPQAMPPYPLLRGWVHAFALYELWSSLPDALAVQVLTASLDYRDLIDGRLARAAAHLRCGDRAAAAVDLTRVLNARHVKSDPVVPVDVFDYDRACRPLLGLLNAGDADEAVRRALWGSAVDVSEDVRARCPRPWALSPRHFERSGYGDRGPEWRLLSKAPNGVGEGGLAIPPSALELARIATDVAASVPSRVILYDLRAEDFFDPPGAEPTPLVDPDLLAAVREHLEVPTHPAVEPPWADVQDRLSQMVRYARRPVEGDEGF